ncbi:hypothetical protein [Geobacter sp. SVR]|uniref:hypothetical protein n=1 Tax=Geobacter sp. SVR TaxID=2495594 RepID=UPI00143F0487|nr:hypothetical protein [Geobacter sp. SVR]BCS54041.1 hypothetical protein GSVR_23490 [Geobacter sp. SVR]GCF86178.1 hypothetical protein GSbR_27780 [Geobacter sp. SVR]
MLYFDSYPTMTPSGKPMTLPTRPITYGVKSNTISFTSDSGHEQRRVRGQAKMTFDLNYPILSLEEYKVLRDFYLKMLNVTAFYWTDPIEKIKYLVRFDMDTFSGQQKYHGPAGPHYELQVKLIQTWN